MSELQIYNTLSRKKEVFKALNPPFVGLYVCGPTVYNEPHLGNLRTFTSFDIVYRYLTYLGYEVRYVRNITDVGHIVNELDEGDDVVLRQAKKENLEPMEIVQKYTNSFHNLVNLFNLTPPSIEPTATGHIIEQMEMVQRIIDNGYAYEKNGSVYFDVPKFAKDHDYGKLSGRNIDDQQDGYRELDAQDEKNDPRDFAIWKYADESHPMRWNSPWGQGVPGWHLECSVMSTKYLGQTFDIHGGGLDLKFPHHECEIAQSVGADGNEPVRYWMHANMLNMNGQKMSKSLGNSILPHELITGEHELLDQAYSPMTIRFFMLQAHYSSELDMTNKGLKDAASGYKRLMNAHAALNELTHQAGNLNADLDQEIKASIDKIFDDLNDDFNTPKAIATMFDLSKKINAFKEGQLDLSTISVGTLELLKEKFGAVLLDVFGLVDEGDASNDVTDGLMDLILNIRKSSRENKDWSTSDMIRDKLTELGIVVKDGKEGTEWSI